MFKKLYRLRKISYEFKLRGVTEHRYYPQFTYVFLKHVMWFNMGKYFYDSYDALVYLRRERLVSEDASVSVSYEDVL